MSDKRPQDPITHRFISVGSIPPSRTQLARHHTKRLLKDPIGQFLVVLAVGLVIASLAAAGVITMKLAWFLLLAAWGAGFGGSYFLDHLWDIKNKHRLRLAVILAITLGCIGIYEQKQQPAASAPTPPTVSPAATLPPTFRQVFNADFTSFFGVGTDLILHDQVTGTDTHLPVRMLLDPSARTKFLAIFLERNLPSFDTARYVIENTENVLRSMDFLEVTTKTPGDTSEESSKRYFFSKTIYFYMDRDMSIGEQSNLIDIANENGIVVQFRGDSYYVLQWHNKEILKMIQNQTTSPPVQSPPVQLPPPLPAGK